MEEENKNKPEDSFSDDSQKNLQIENEILKLKLQAELGAVFEGEADLSPNIENQFLLQVSQFEEAWKNVKYVKVYDTLGKPTFRKADAIPASEMQTELDNMMQLLNEHNFYLDVLGQYEPEVIYRFITEELFEHETDDMQLPGWTKNFIYEEFHPNHKMDIEKRAEDFIHHWFGKGFNEYSLELNKEFVLPAGEVLSQEQVIQKLNNSLACYASFSHDDHTVTEISFQWNEEENKGIGHAEGMIQYNAQLESGETRNVEGPFKFYMANEYGVWQIFYFVFPGFSW